MPLRTIHVSRVVPENLIESANINLLEVEESYIWCALQYEVSKRYPYTITQTLTDDWIKRGIRLHGEVYDPESVFEELDRLREEVDELKAKLKEANLE